MMHPLRICSAVKAEEIKEKKTKRGRGGRWGGMLQ